MSDISRVRRGSESSPFPVIRKSADPLQPESGEVQFSAELAKFDSDSTSTVQGTDKTESSVIHEDSRRKHLKKRAAGPHGDEKEGEPDEGDIVAKTEENLVDLEV